MPDKNFNQYLGLRLAESHADGVTIECRLGEKHLNFAGVLHGGVTAALADVAVGQALMKRGYKCTTVELKVSYLRPVVGRKVTARSHLLRIGKTLCIGRVDVFDQEKKLAAVAIVTYMLLDGGTYATKPRNRRGSTA